MDLESATVLAFQYMAQNPHLLQGVEARQALKDFADLVAVAHPTKLCVRGPPRPVMRVPVLTSLPTTAPSCGRTRLQAAS